LPVGFFLADLAKDMASKKRKWRKVRPEIEQLKRWSERVEFAQLEIEFERNSEEIVGSRWVKKKTEVTLYDLYLREKREPKKPDPAEFLSPEEVQGCKGRDREMLGSMRLAEMEHDVMVEKREREKLVSLLLYLMSELGHGFPLSKIWSYGIQPIPKK